MIKKLISICLLVLLCNGCLVVRHETTRLDGVKDSGTLKAFLVTGKAAQLKTRTSMNKDGVYLHSSGASDVEGRGDAEFIQAITEGIVAGLKKSQVP